MPKKVISVSIKMIELTFKSHEIQKKFCWKKVILVILSLAELLLLIQFVSSHQQFLINIFLNGPTPASFAFINSLFNRTFEF